MRESGRDVKRTLDAAYIEITSFMYLGSSLLNFIRFAFLCQSSTMLFRLFTTAILLLSITSVKTYSVPYQSIQLAFSITPKLIYTSESNPAFSGYSYTTQDFNGGESNVVFTTGADSMSRLKDEMDSMKMLQGYLQGDKNLENIIALGQQQFKSEKAEESSKKEDLDSNEVLNEEKNFSKNSAADNNLIERPTNFQQISLDVPYPAIEENFLNLQLPAFPRYQTSSNVIQSQYYPHNPYARLELPLNDFGFYNPTVPLFYQAATIIPDHNSKSTLTDENMKASTESHMTKSSQTNFTNSESNLTKSRIDSKSTLESTTNGIEETSSSLSTIPMNKREPTTTSEKIKEEITTSETAVTSQSPIEQTTSNETSSTELVSTETIPLTEKSSTARSKRCLKRLN